MPVPEKPQNPRRHAAVLVSLGSPQMNAEGLKRLTVAAREHDCSDIIFCLLDDPEVVNLTVLYRLTEHAARAVVAERLVRVQSYLRESRWPDQTVIVASALASSEPEFRLVLDWVVQLAQSNKRFRSSCENQVYRNLHPALRSRGVQSRRDVVVSELAGYFFSEIAAKLFIARKYSVDMEITFGEEAEVVKELFSGAFGSPPGGLPPRPEVLPVPPSPRAGGLVVQGISFAYGRGRGGSESFGLRDCSFTVPSGSITGIYGPSGSGKTTLLRIIGGHLTPKEGDVLLGQNSLLRSRSRERDTVMVFQNGALFPFLTIEGNIAYGLFSQKSLTRSDRAKLVGSFLELMGLANKRHCYPSELSGGERQRVALARALVLGRKILLLDEPTTALDHLKKVDISRYLRQALSVPPAPTAVLVSHDHEFLFSLCTHLIVMDRGSIVAEGPTESVLTHPPNTRVAEVLGTHGWIPGSIDDDGAFHYRDLEGTSRTLPLPSTRLSSIDNQLCYLLVPPEAISIVTDEHGGAIPAEVVDTIRVRGGIAVTFRVSREQPITAGIPALPAGSSTDGNGKGVGERLWVKLDSSYCRVLSE